MPKVKSTPALAMLMIFLDTLNSSAISLTVLKNTVLLKQAASVIQLVEKTIMHLRHMGADCMLTVALASMSSMLDMAGCAAMRIVGIVGSGSGWDHEE